MTEKHPYDDHLTIREETVEGVGPWHWVKTDCGAWNGPSKEFAGLRRFFTEWCRETRVMVQAGGCLGMYPRLWADVFDVVHTFEPDPLNYHCLTRNAVTGPLKRGHVIPYHSALGATNDPVWVKVESMANVGMHRVGPVRERGDVDRVTQFRIDDLNLAWLDAIQLDAEGYEPAIIAGARETILKFRPVISVETLDLGMETFFLKSDYVEVGTNVSDKIFVPKESINSEWKVQRDS